MTEQSVSAYLGPGKGRWVPASWSDVIDAAAGGLLDESHWVELKRELPSASRTANTELAKDLASLAVDGGLLVVGIEDRDSRAGNVCGVQLAGLADRVDQIARSKVHPPLVVRSHEIRDPGRSDWGCLLVHVPPSAQAPHMVDQVYYGRSDRGKIRLDDAEVRRIIEQRRLGCLDVLAELRRMAEDDPIRPQQREHGHLYLLAQPEFASEEMFLDLLGRSDVVQVLQEVLGQVRDQRGSGHRGFVPDIDYLQHRVPRAEGMALASYSVEDPPRREVTLLEMVIREDGGIRLICGRGTDAPGDKCQMAVLVMLVLGLTHLVVALAGRLADQFAGYQGQWQLGIRMDWLRGVVPYDKLQSPLGTGDAYTRDDYERVVTASTEELVNAPHAVAERLTAPLLRGLGIAEKYLPYKP